MYQWHRPHSTSMSSRVYVMVRCPSVRLSVPSINRSNGGGQVCCWAPASAADTDRQLRAPCCMRRAADAGSSSKVYGYSSSRSNLPHRYGNSHAIWDHTVLPATRQSWHFRIYPSRSWYSIKRPQRDARLSWPSWLVTYRDGIPARRRSPIQVLTGPDVR